MLYIVDGEKYTKISAKDLANELKLNPYVIQCLQKKAPFKQRPERLKPDRNNPALRKANRMTNFPASFSMKRNGVRVFLHLCDSDFPNEKGVPQLLPARTSFDGATFSITEDFDKALFLYLHPFNASSPLSPGNKNYLYTFVNVKEEAKSKMDALDNLEIAFNKFRELPDVKVKFLVRGLGLALNVENTSQEELSFLLKNYAKENPVDFINRCDGDLSVHFKGRVLNLFDKGYFQVISVNNSRQWVVTQGAMKGQYVGDPIINKFQDAEDHLINSINVDLGTYEALLREAYNATSTNTDFENNIRESNILDMLGDDAAPVVAKVTDEFYLPDSKDKKAVAELLKSYSVPANVNNINAICSLIASGQLDKSNIAAMMNNLKA